MILSKDIKSKLQEAAAQKQHQQFTSAGTLTRPSPTAKSLPKSLEAVTSEHIVGDNALSTQARPLVRSTDAELADRNALDPSMVPVMISSWKPGSKFCAQRDIVELLSIRLASESFWDSAFSSNF
jgi:hypothetical protein